jgi:hypothetical protein
MHLLPFWFPPKISITSIAITAQAEVIVTAPVEHREFTGLTFL